MAIVKKLLITAGPTREHLDPVRFITNLSSGRMGYALAGVAAAKGYQVSLVSGPTHLKVPRGVQYYPVISSHEMKRVCSKLFPSHDGLIMTAAVCDYMPSTTDRHKRSSIGGLTLKLKRTPDILADLSKRKGDRIVIGFCLETRSLVQRAKEKVRQKKLDGIVANFYSPRKQVPFGDNKVRAILIDRDMKVIREPMQNKTSLSWRILRWMEKLNYER